MSRNLLQACLIGVVLFAVQAAWVQFAFQEQYESRALIQVQSPAHLDQAKLVCTPETLRGFLEAREAEDRIRDRWLPESRKERINAPLVPRQAQILIANAGLFGFRFRHRDPEVAFNVARSLVAELRTRWEETFASRVLEINRIDSLVLDVTLGEMDRQLAGMPSLATSSATFEGIPGALGFGLTLRAPSPAYVALEDERNRFRRRREELRVMEETTVPASYSLSRWTLLEEPSRPTLPVWPTRWHLFQLSLLNTVFWLLVWVFWKRFRPA